MPGALIRENELEAPPRNPIDDPVLKIIWWGHWVGAKRQQRRGFSKLAQLTGADVAAFREMGGETAVGVGFRKPEGKGR